MMRTRSRRKALKALSAGAAGGLRLRDCAAVPYKATYAIERLVPLDRLCTHDGNIVDDHNNVVIESKEAVAALDYARTMNETFHRRHIVVNRACGRMRRRLAARRRAKTKEGRAALNIIIVERASQVAFLSISLLSRP
jgi:hypothetical protein